MHASDKLGTLIHDLKQFTSVFATPIHQSAPHIYVSALAFAPTSSVIYELCRQFPRSVRMRQGRMVDWPRLVRVFTGHFDGVNAVAISPDGSLVVSGSGDQTVRFWNAATGMAIGEPLTGHSNWVNAVAFSPDGTRVVSGSDDQTVRVWSVKTFAAIGEPLIGHDDSINLLHSLLTGFTWHRVHEIRQFVCGMQLLVPQLALHLSGIKEWCHL